MPHCFCFLGISLVYHITNKSVVFALIPVLANSTPASFIDKSQFWQILPCCYFADIFVTCKFCAGQIQSLLPNAFADKSKFLQNLPLLLFAGKFITCKFCAGQKNKFSSNSSRSTCKFLSGVFIFRIQCLQFHSCNLIKSKTSLKIFLISGA